MSTLAFSHRLCEIFASNLHVTGCLANQVSYQVAGFINVADEAPGLLDMRDSAGSSPDQYNDILVSGDGVIHPQNDFQSFWWVERGAITFLAHNLLDVLGTQSRLAQIETAIEVNLENPKMFYIISTSLRGGSRQDREDSVEFIDSK